VVPISQIAGLVSAGLSIRRRHRAPCLGINPNQFTRKYMEYLTIFLSNVYCTHIFSSPNRAFQPKLGGFHAIDEFH
jgi:hypothetical protein